MEQEGYIQYQLNHTQRVLPEPADFEQLVAVRRELYRKKWIGETDDGVGYGNVSMRLSNGAGFLVSGTQTGGAPEVTIQQFAQVIEWDVARNKLVSCGPVAPSSEALTHAALYAIPPAKGPLNCVLHVHVQEAWERGKHDADTPKTPDGITYGTVKMAEAVKTLFQLSPNQAVLMAGHEGGWLAAGPSPLAAYRVLESALSRLYN